MNHEGHEEKTEIYLADCLPYVLHFRAHAVKIPWLITALAVSPR